MEASTGIEPVYTDLQSIAFINEINAKSPKEYQDKTGTKGEFDTLAQSDGAKKNPGASAVATEVQNAYEAGQLRGQNSPKPRHCAIRNRAEIRHKQAARAIARGLVHGADTAAWQVVGAALELRLSEQERALIALAAMLSLPQGTIDTLGEIVACPPPVTDPRITEAAMDYRRAFQRGARV